ncbi:MAG: hypothetical protein PHN49_10475 [Candidatus Omnitrophica bacterium]|nr:hypothetical protein [Candidatus Omnitrophota bacterium]MDD5672054.1 hypothetical protein [Candidatus Omnitrophota bacterium]
MVHTIFYFKTRRICVVSMLAVLFLLSHCDVRLHADIITMPRTANDGARVESATMSLAGRNSTNLPRSVHELLSIHPTSRSVGMVFAAHGVPEDADWAIGQVREILRDVDRNRPIVVWIEHAEPLGLPQTVRELQEQFQNPKGPAIQWSRELMRNPMRHEPLSLLFALFKQAQKQEADPMPFFLKTADPYTRHLRAGLGRLNQEGWKIQIQIEKPAFESYLRTLQWNAMNRAAGHWLSLGDGRKAFASLGMAYRFFARSLEVRDQVLGRQMLRSIKQNPDAFHVVIRGIAHEGGMSRCFFDQKISVSSVIQRWYQPAAWGNSNVRISDYLSQYHELPTIETSAGRGFILKQLRGSVAR